MRIQAATGLAAVLAALALPAAGAEWQLVRKNKDAMLSVDSQSVKRNGDEVAFQYLVDLREAQGDLKQGPQFRSVVTQARVRCKARTISLGESEMFVPNRGQGAAIGRSDPKGATGTFSPLEKGTSDEDLWGHLCAPKDAKPKDAKAAK
jgi:hypothetical protein